MRRWFFYFFPIIAVLAAFFAFGCSSNRFLIYKNGKAYYFATRQEGLHHMLCDSGDFKKVLDGSTVPESSKDALYRYNCVQQDCNKVQALYVSLTPDQRRSIRESFEKQGYEINYFPCG